MFFFVVVFLCVHPLGFVIMFFPERVTDLCYMFVFLWGRWAVDSRKGKKGARWGLGLWSWRLRLEVNCVVMGCFCSLCWPSTSKEGNKGQMQVLGFICIEINLVSGVKAFGAAFLGCPFFASYRIYRSIGFACRVCRRKSIFRVLQVDGAEMCHRSRKRMAIP